MAATGTSSPFSKAITGLSAGTPYYYKAYIVEGGQEVLGAEESFTTKAVATATVTTTAATGVTYSSATLNATFTGASGTIYDRGFRYKKGSGSWVTPTGLGSIAGTSGSFSMEISSLDSESTYIFQAYVTEYNENTGQYEDHWAASTQTFTTTSAPTPQPATGWLELPELKGTEDFVGKFYGSGSTAGTNRNYSYNYSFTYYASMWVAYPLYFTHKSGSASTSSWRYNPNIANNKQVNIVSNSYGTMYGEDGYARGHQCPNASRKSDDNMNLQTYYATNQTPQLQNKFNGSIWGSLEAAVRNLVTSSSDTVYVVTGPAYRKVNGSETINYLTGVNQNANPSSLPIPNYYWKALLKVKRNGSGDITSAKAIGFWFDHRNYESSEHYYDSEHVVSVNQIETWTGLNLFHNLPGDDSSGIEQTAEANTSWTDFQSF